MVFTQVEFFAGGGLRFVWSKHSPVSAIFLFPSEMCRSSLYFKDLNTWFDKHDENTFQFVTCFLSLIF